MLWLLASACAARAPTSAGDPTARPPVTAPDQALALVRALPADAERCVYAQPARFTRPERALLSRLSQTEPLPWTLTLPVLAYARAERSAGGGERVRVEYVKFASGSPEALRRAIDAAAGRPLLWEGEAGEPCDGELTCVPVHARVVAPQLVELTQGRWPRSAGEGACVELARAHPEALEVSQRSGGLGGSELRESTSVLRLGARGLTRETARRYESVQAARRALSAARRGEEEPPSLLGIPASTFPEQRAELLLQRATVSFEELALAARDRERALRSPPAAVERSPSALEARESERVRAAFDHAEARLRRLPADSRELSEWGELLARARRFAPDDEGLAARQFVLQLALRRDAGAASDLAREALRRGLGGREVWQLRLRTALLRHDPEALTRELASAHGLSLGQARRMSRELAQKLGQGAASGRPQGVDYGRAEWAFLGGLALAPVLSRASERVRGPTLPLLELPRLFSYLARAGAADGELRVRLLVPNGVLPEPLPEAHAGGQVWSESTGAAGSDALLLGAAGQDDAALSALGRDLARATRDGPLALAFELAFAGDEQPLRFALRGERAGANIALRKLSPPLSRLDWETLERLLLAPLCALVGNLYPPDELVIEARDEDEAARLLDAASAEPRASCTLEQRTLRCRGALADRAAAPRILHALARRFLAREARVLWSARRAL